MIVSAGAATRVVEVLPGTPMAGFAARTRPSSGVHDPLTVRALVLDGVAVVSVDVCALHERTTARIRRALGGAVRHCVVSATHTHAGPCVAFGRVGGHDDVTHERVVRAAVGAVQDALAGAVDATLEYAEAFGTGVARNRRHPDRRIDPAVQALRLRDDSGSVIAHLVQYPCHPVVLDGSNADISADYPHALRAAVEAAHPGSVCLFVSGAAGDVNTGHPAEASYSDRPSAGRTFAEAERVGGVLAAAVLAAPARPVYLDLVRFATTDVELALEPVTDARRHADLERWRRERADADPGLAALLDVWIGWAERTEEAPASWTGRVSVVDAGVLLVFLPGEPFLAVAERIAESVDDDVLVIGYADAVPGYLPTREEYAHGGYEVDDAHRYYGMPAPFAPGGAEALVEAALRLIGALRGG
ncbi:neutral/alkaline non-lysosomal ceramidase N-terminal domain-containing protein [Georgenia faecalis]|uniref:neutral/alkaline non-lysosomal ceramidase N-terminal domain-containing protein n=1 Tax=Georgenia faecalis TaxID=2483799 RepID=UPI000FD8674A|nr:neutral/alkaline non-lysosomal ceramidase N-terminal domain-containing protein [Georgenia faecalis]